MINGIRPTVRIVSIVPFATIVTLGLRVYRIKPFKGRSRYK